MMIETGLEILITCMDEINKTLDARLSSIDEKIDKLIIAIKMLQTIEEKKN
ncbi:hypothetical protein ABG79_02367 [Caloramator mitchellensis]|uniref:Uncharacterized protein n=1 Tax=Caloramator mitchellensis TaxID=908809 RepID=A0A0R3JUE6_CALMK|nr:hypothetical protein [Caloramator mitchellensis]KRQ85853.1 hypothetical protein ABG79_02367 [Caloramator mitchellensis]